jgi:chaperonin GroEL (HSP60 family)
VISGLVGDEKTGAEIVARAIEAPLRQLAINAGLEGALIVAEVKKGSGNHGYNVATAYLRRPREERCGGPNQGDPQRLQNAASISGLLLTTECLILFHQAPLPSGRSAFFWALALARPAPPSRRSQNGSPSDPSAQRGDNRD